MYDPCIFYRRPTEQEFIMIIVHVDDFLVAATTDELIMHVEATFRLQYQLTISDNAENYLGMHIVYNSDSSITVSNPVIIRELLEKTNLMESTASVTPMRSDFNDDYQDDSPMLSVALKLTFQEILGSLIFIVKTRPDIAYAVNRLATRTARATERDLTAINRVVRYLKGTEHLGLTFTSPKEHSSQDYIQLVLYADAAYITHKDGKSHSGISLHFTSSEVANKTGVISSDINDSFITTAPFITSSTKQANVSLSSTEAEIEPVVEGIKSGIWASELLTEMGLKVRHPMIIYEDNLSAIHLATQLSGNHKRTKHYLVRIGFLLEQFRRHLVRYIHVDTYDQIADILTKPLGEGDFVRLRHMLLGCKVPYRKV
jgi:hypothetical protein